MARRRFRRARDGAGRALVTGLAAGLAVALVALVGFDLAGAGRSPATQSAVRSIDPLAGGAAATTAGDARLPEGTARAGFLPAGELLLEPDGEGTRGTVFLDGAAVPPLPAVIDSVAAGDHRLRMEVDGATVWEQPVRLDPAGVEMVRIPALADSAPVDSASAR